MGIHIDDGVSPRVLAEDVLDDNKGPDGLKMAKIKIGIHF